jgi:hypothetical protein
LRSIAFSLATVATMATLAVAAAVLSPLSAAAAAAAAAQDNPAGPKLGSRFPPPRHFEIHRAASAIAVDGDLSEEAWASATTWDVPYEWNPGDNVPSPVPTDFLITYDEQNVYAAWRCHDPNPKAIRAHLMDRDDTDTLVQDDHVVLLLDPFGDGRRAVQFRVNPLGVQADAINAENEGIEDFSFDMIWAAAAKITADGYNVEIAIPLSQLRFPRTQAIQTWRIDVGRSYPRDVRHRMSAYPRDRDIACTLCQVDYLTGFEGLKPGHNLEVTPTLTARRTDQAADVGEDLGKGDEKTDFGVSVRWGITPNISLNAAINPDFSQVEADVAQLAANERFALFFPEKRPFFLEGLDLFATPISALFTRTVVDPEWGVKLSGKEGKNAFGVFVARDAADANLILLPTNQETGSAFLFDQKITSSALRYRRDLGATSSIGMIYTGREGDDYNNRVGGLDGTFRPSDVDTIKAQALFSSTLYPEELVRSVAESSTPQPDGTFTGRALYLDWIRSTRDWTYRSTYEERTPDFRADSGFIPRTDFRDLKASIQRQFYGAPDAFLNQSFLGVFVDRTEDMEGELTDDLIQLYAQGLGPLQSFGEVLYERAKTRFEGRLFEGLNTVRVNGSFQPSGAFRFALNTAFGDAVDFAIAERANLLEIGPAIEWKAGQHLNVKLKHTERQLTRGSEKTLDAGLSELRLAYNFNVRSFARVILQYLDDHSDLTVPPGHSRSLFSQLLYSYKLNPQTVFFLGYSDNRGNDFRRNIPIEQTDRTFFLKIGYALAL